MCEKRLRTARNSQRECGQAMERRGIRRTTSRYVCSLAEMRWAEALMAVALMLHWLSRLAVLPTSIPLRRVLVARCKVRRRAQCRREGCRRQSSHLVRATFVIDRFWLRFRLKWREAPRTPLFLPLVQPRRNWHSDQN